MRRSYKLLRMNTVEHEHTMHSIVLCHPIVAWRQNHSLTLQLGGQVVRIALGAQLREVAANLGRIEDCIQHGSIVFAELMGRRAAGLGHVALQCLFSAGSRLGGGEMLTTSSSDIESTTCVLHECYPVSAVECDLHTGSNMV